MMPLSKLFHMKKKRFILTIGDEGAILIYMEGKVLKQRLFSTLDSGEGKQAFEKLLASAPKVPVSLVLDVVEQSCVQQSLPAVSMLSINKLVKRRLERDYPPEDIKGVLPLGRETMGRKDWNYMFIAAHMVSPLTDWLELVVRQQNAVAGIFMLPVEGANFLKAIQKKFSETSVAKKEKKTTSWQCVVLHNKVSGFRQVVLKNGKLVFTRLIHSSEHDLPGVVAGNIEQEVVNTLEYLRRLSFEEESEINIYIGVSQEIKTHFEITEIQGHSVTVITPYEVAEALGLKKVAQLQDKYMDVVFAASFMQHRPTLTLHSPETRVMSGLMMANAFAKVFAVSLLPIIVVYIAYTVVDINRMTEVIELAQEKQDSLKQVWQEKQKISKDMETKDFSKVSDMVGLYQLLSRGFKTPLTVISRFGAIKGKNVLVSSIDWQLFESVASRKEKKPPSISVIFNVELYSSGTSFDELFNNFDDFINRVKEGFAGYRVEYSELPERLALDKKNKVIPIQVRITGADL